MACAVVVGLLVGLVAGVLAGCTASKLDRSAAVSLTGTVVDAAGAPLAGTRVVLLKEADLGEVFASLVTTLGTLGLACLAPQLPSFCSGVRRTTTDGSGAFSFQLKGSDTQGSVGNADSFDLAAAGTNVRFRIQRTSLAIPTLRVWNGAVSVSGSSSGALQVRRADLPASYGGSPSYSVTFRDGVSQQAVWSVSPAASTVAVDARVLEDHSGLVSAEARVRQPGPDTNFDVTYRSQTVPFTGPGAPPSRHAPCSVSGAGQAPRPLQPCGLTDGALFTPAPLGSEVACSGCSPPVLNVVTLDLGSVRPASFVVVRGAAGGPLAVDGSADGSAWVSLGTATGALSTLAPPGAPRVRFVRLRTSSSLAIGGLDEVSVWP